MSNALHILIKQCLAGSSQAQEQLYRHFYGEMIRVCMRYAGDEDGAGIIYNNAMLNVFRGLGSYKEEGRLESWVRTVVIHAALDFVRARQRFSTINGLPGEEADLPAEAIQQLSMKEIQQMIIRLPKATRTVFNLFAYEGYQHNEIARMLGISEGTSKWHVNRARQLLQVQLAPYIKTN